VEDLVTERGWLVVVVEVERRDALAVVREEFLRRGAGIGMHEGGREVVRRSGEE